MSALAFERVSDSKKAKLREPYPPQSMGGADQSVMITMSRLDADKGNFSFEISLEADFRDIKQQVEAKWEIPISEQVLLFMGRPVKEEDAFQPFIMPDVQEMIDKLEKDSLKMSVIKRPNKTHAFLRQEGLLVKGVPDLNLTTKHGATALHRSVRQFQVSVVKDLLSSRSFTLVNAVDKQQQSALHTAVQCRFREMCELLLVGQPHFTAVSCVDENGQTALHLAACWGDAKVVRMILDHEYFNEEHANLRDDQGFTALQYANDCGHEDARRMISEFAPPVLEEEEEEAVSPIPLAGVPDGNDIPHDSDMLKHASSSAPTSSPADVRTAADEQSSKLHRETSELPSLNWAALCLNAVNRSL